MGCEWERAKIEDVVKKVAMGPFGSSIKISTFVSEGIPVISGQHLNEVRLHDKEYNFITIDHADKLKNSNVYRGDVIFTHAGNIGQVAYIPENSKYERYIISQRQFYMRCDLKRILPSFVTYYFKSPEGRHKLLANTSSTGVPSISRPVSYLRTIEVPVPPLPEQLAISHILGSLDDKIELNRRMNETLEAMARAIFKSWFVNFDPVRAKAEGRDTGLPKEIADLFPDSLEDSELKEIPKGWKIKPIGEAVRCVGGSTPSTKNPEFWNGGTNSFVTPKDMSSLSSPVLLETTRHISDAGVEKISSGRLPVGTVLLSSRAPIGYLAITETPVSVNQGIIAMICDKELPNYYVLYWTEENMETIKSNAGGTTFAEISKSNFRPIQVVVPHKRVLEAFVQQVEPLHKQVVLKHLARETAWEKVQIFLCGGGANLPYVEGVFSTPWKWSNLQARQVKYPVSKLPTPDDYDAEEIDAPFERLAIAYGLARPIPELEQYVLPSGSPDHTPPRLPVQDFDHEILYPKP